jgi:hypothetical protein
MATSPVSSQSSGVPGLDRLTRNWKWVVPVFLLAALLLVGGFIGTILFVVESSFQHSDCYVQALAKTRANPEVGEKIGEPITPGWFSSGSINLSGPSGNADITIPIRGSKGKGKIYVVAEKRAGAWSFETLQVEIEGNEQRIDLLQATVSQPSVN